MSSSSPRFALTTRSLLDNSEGGCYRHTNLAGMVGDGEKGGDTRIISMHFSLATLPPILVSKRTTPHPFLSVEIKNKND